MNGPESIFSKYMIDGDQLQHFFVNATMLI